MIRMYVKIAKNCEGHIFLYIHIQFVRTVEAKLLAQFLVDNLVHPVVSSLILSLR